MDFTTKDLAAAWGIQRSSTSARRRDVAEWLTTVVVAAGRELAPSGRPQCITRSIVARVGSLAALYAYNPQGFERWVAAQVADAMEAQHDRRE